MLMKICVQVFVPACFQFSGYIPRSGITGSYGNYMFNILRENFSKVAAHFILPPANNKGSIIFHILMNVCYYLSFILAILVGVK